MTSNIPEIVVYSSPAAWCYCICFPFFLAAQALQKVLNARARTGCKHFLIL